MPSFILIQRMRHGWVSVFLFLFDVGSKFEFYFCSNLNHFFSFSPQKPKCVATCTHIGHPFGSLLSGFISDAVGRRKALIFIVAPAVLAFIGLAFADSFIIVCALFFFLSFIFGLKDAPATIYVSEVSEPSVCISISHIPLH